ncbi:MerR family transcriptional regulator [Amycolatopsis sp. GM8]|uniref:MerR family transcriptional regulator n=1 Tax=Amycolatopsis sp. GM8 TaxID=2896530 RepID=UPI001F1ADC51|nr:MerR family transcriptional regulator [Amycolatopsis sp. GM8]
MSYSIAEAARRSGLSIDTLRYYERIKLVDPPSRDTAGRRAYSDDDLTWLVFLTHLRTTGMPIKMMREYAQLRHHGDASAARRMGILVEQRASVRARIADLQSCLDVLDYKIDNYDRICRDMAGAGATVEEMSA